MAKKKKTRTAPFGLIIVVGLVITGVSIYRTATTTPIVRESKEEVRSTVAIIVDDTVSAFQAPDKRKMDSIRDRETVKRQQEIIVMETYLLEEKEATTEAKAAELAEIEDARAKAIAEFDAEEASVVKAHDNTLSNIESQLENVRADKLSFL